VPAVALESAVTLAVGASYAVALGAPISAVWVLPLGAVTVRVLHPPVPDWQRPWVRNDDSLVLEIVYVSVAILLTGDISEAVERESSKC
jgi:beta-lactamase superfamily II metal-dependent hydrolase